MGANNTQEVLELLKAAGKNPFVPANLPEAIAKAFTQSGSATTGLTFYDLEAPSKKLFPVITPLRNKIPRISGKGGIQANWKAVTGININSLSAGVSQGNRGGVIATSTADYLAAYKGIGFDDYTTFEAQYAGRNFEDIRALMGANLLRATMIAEELLIVGGNTSVPLGTTPTPTLAASGSGGTLATQTLSVIVVALAPDAFWAVAGANNGATQQAVNIPTAVVPASVTRTNADGTSDTYGGGAARKSSNATVSVTGPTGSATATVAAVAGAVGYAWYWGTAGSEVLGAITTINSVSITATATGTQTAASLPAADNSTNSLVFDGILSQIAKSGSGAYQKVMATGTPGTGTGLTSDGGGGIVEIDDALIAFWNSIRSGPDVIYVNAQEARNITKKIVANGGAPLVRFNLDGNNPGVVSANTVVGSYMNKITQQVIPLVVHPNIPPGTILFWSDGVPYPLNGIDTLVRILCRQDYYQIDWPIVKRRYESGVYADEVLQNYFPPAFGVISNIANL